jgi:hypothetical protein
VKISRLETHDRLLHLQKSQWETISQGANDCMLLNRDSLEIQSVMPYVYLFAHPRLTDDGVNTRLLWQARISRPIPQTNSYCFRGISNTDTLEICWLLPPMEMWGQYKKGNVTESDVTAWSIHQFCNNFKALEAPHPDDMSDEVIRWRIQGTVPFKKI